MQAQPIGVEQQCAFGWGRIGAFDGAESTWAFPQMGKLAAPQRQQGHQRVRYTNCCPFCA
jgi:hypothetical protein